MSQHWRENSIGLMDQVIYVTSSPQDWDERIVLRITDCKKTNLRSDTKELYRKSLSIKDAESLLEMLKDAVAHYHSMEQIAKVEVASEEEE